MFGCIKETSLANVVLRATCFDVLGFKSVYLVCVTSFLGVMIVCCHIGDTCFGRFLTSECAFRFFCVYEHALLAVVESLSSLFERYN